MLNGLFDSSFLTISKHFTREVKNTTTWANWENVGGIRRKYLLEDLTPNNFNM